MKPYVLAFAATLVATPAFADCTADLQEQSNKVSEATQAVSATAQGSMEEQCASNGELLAQTKQLVDIYDRCQSELGITQEQIDQMRQQIESADINYQSQCG